MAAIKYQELFELGSNQTEYELLTKDYVSAIIYDQQEFLKIDPKGLTYLAEQATHAIAFFLRSSQLDFFKTILLDPEASSNDQYVAKALIENAIIASTEEFPLCQDTGTITIFGKKGECVLTNVNDQEAFSRGVFQTYTNDNLRYSQVAPLSMYEEKNTACNLPAQIDLYTTTGHEYDLLFIAKGGGSANKTFLFQHAKSLLNTETLLPFLKEAMLSLGTSACPPYHLAIVIGGTSAESTLKTVKLASTGYLDALPTSGNENGRAFRDLALEKEALKISEDLGIGAQFGGKYFCLDVRVIRLPRHGASCPVGIGVSCNAHRQVKAKITKEGIFLEKLEKNPSRYLPEQLFSAPRSITINLNQSIDAICAILNQHPIKTMVLLNGDIIVARDIAHAKLKEKLDQGEELPEYFKNHIIYYAGPAKTPAGYASGSFGPTTAARMDPYVPIFQKQGASRIMLAKGNRSQQVIDACQKYNGFYLGSIGGPAALFGKNYINQVECIEYPELGMEAIYKINVKNFPAFIITDNKGNDFFQYFK